MRLNPNVVAPAVVAVAFLVAGAIVTIGMGVLSPPADDQPPPHLPEPSDVERIPVRVRLLASLSPVFEVDPEIAEEILHVLGHASRSKNADGFFKATDRLSKASGGDWEEALDASLTIRLRDGRSTVVEKIMESGLDFSYAYIDKSGYFLPGEFKHHGHPGPVAPLWSLLQAATLRHHRDRRTP
jgi:hypothetical protein